MPILIRPVYEDHAMLRTACGAALALLGFTLVGLAGDDDARLKDAFALEEAIQNAIQTAEPAIACIAVSRSEEYQKYPGHSVSAENPGQLGEFFLENEAKSSAPDSESYKRARRLDLSLPTTVPESFGSGVVVDEKERLVLTNYHVVRDAAKVYVRLPGDQGSYANIHAADPRSDLAVLRLIDPKVRLKAIKMGDGSEARKGQFVISLANPYAAGFRDGSASASWGIISNIRRRSAGPTDEAKRPEWTLAQFSTLLETDARLNLGCSGGALVNLKGEMIGLTSSLAAITGVETPGGFALPMSPPVQKILGVLKRGEEVEYGFLGITMKADLIRRMNAYPIGEVMLNSPATAAGLKPNAPDQPPHTYYILSVDGQRVHEGDDLYLYIGTGLAGSTVTLEVRTEPGGTITKARATLAKSFVPGKIVASKRPNPRDYGGLRVDYGSILVQRQNDFRRDTIPEGVVIREVISGSPADAAGLQVDKLITQVGTMKVETPELFYREMRNATGSVDLTLQDATGKKTTVKLQLR